MDGSNRFYQRNALEQAAEQRGTRLTAASECIWAGRLTRSLEVIK